MKIEWLGLSSFKLTESTGTSIITDPYYPTAGRESVENADIVTLSHKYDGHNNNASGFSAPIIIDKAGAYEIKGVHISSIISNLDKTKSKLHSKNIIFKFRMDGVDICHLGDISQDLSAMLAEMIGTVNILLIPIGGHTTLDAEQAKDYIDHLMPDIVIPMHYKTRDSNLELEELDEFLNLFDEEDVEIIYSSELEFNRAYFDNERTKVLVFDKNGR